MKYLSPFLLSICLLFSCERVKQDSKKIVHSAGKTVGSTITEFGKGVAEGVEEGLAYEIILSQELIAQKLSSGDVKVTSDSTGTDNKLSVYLSFGNDYEQEIIAIVNNTRSKEMGRTSTLVKAKKGESFYVDFIFPPSTNIDRDSQITLK